MADPRVGDIGVEIEVTITKADGTVRDISNATTRTIKLRSPSGVVKSFSASFVTDGTDGKMIYITTAAADLDEAGIWQCVGFIAFSQDGKQWHTESAPIAVEEVFE